jgi:hypothetical protein
MTVSTTTIKNSYSGNGSTTAFSYTFKVFASSEVKVIVRTDSTGAESVRAEGSGSTNYAVTGVGEAGGGTVTFVTAPASGETVVILRDTALTQATDYQPADPFPAESHEDALDKLTHITQEIQEELDRSFKVSRTNAITTPEFVDSASTRASKLLGFSSDGNTLQATTGRVSSVSVSNVAVDGSGVSQSATVSFNDTTGALALGVPVGSTGAQGPAGDLSDPTTTQHDIIVRGASAVERLAKGANSTVLNTNASGALAYSKVSTAMIADDAVTYAKMQHTSTGNRVLGAASAGALGEVQIATDMIADDAVTLAKMASGTDGNLITYDSSGNPAHVATGSSGQVLTSNGAGAAPTFQAAAGGWSHVETKTGNNSAMTFSHTVESGYDYQFVFRNCNLGGDHSTDTYIPHLQVGTGAGPTFQTSGYLNQTLMTDSTTVTAERDGLTKGISIHGNMGTIGGDSDNEYMSGQMTIFDPGAATKTVSQGRMFIDDGSLVPHMNITAGRYDTAVAVTAFRFTSDVFQFESGTVSLYRKAIS